MVDIKSDIVLANYVLTLWLKVMYAVYTQTFKMGNG